MLEVKRSEYSDEYHFLEDERVYLTKLYGDGKPLDASSFLRLDISGLKATSWPVRITNDPLNVYGVADARLASLSIGSLTLSPAFNKSVFVYLKRKQVISHRTQAAMTPTIRKEVMKTLLMKSFGLLPATILLLSSGNQT